MLPRRVLPDASGRFRPAAAAALRALARRHGTPLYVYDLDAVHDACRAYQAAFAATPHLICAAVKANGNLGLLRRLAAWGSGFDVVSGGELERVLRAGGRPERIVFSGVGKTAAELDAGLRAGILLFNVESEAELELLARRALRLRRHARFALRVNPDVAADTHAAIATGARGHKFGVAPALALRLYRRAAREPRFRRLTAAGISCHIGSQILATAPFAAAAARLAALVRQLAREDIALPCFDLGGGLGVAYAPGQRPPALAAYARAIARARAGAGERLLLEPGRSLFAHAGLLLTRVLGLKTNGGNRFVVVDAGSNDFARPSLYGAYHRIVALAPRPGRAHRVEIVGPLCETGDVLGSRRSMPPLRAGDLLAILDAGAYGMSLASNYNTRPRAAEIGLEAGRAHLLRRRETIDQLLAPELPLRSL